MITWTSLRSGMASSGVRPSAQIAAAMAKRVRMRTRKGLRALASMTRSSKKGGVGDSANRGVGESAMLVPSWFDQPLLRLLNHFYDVSEHFLVSIIDLVKRFVLAIATP